MHNDSPSWASILFAKLGISSKEHRKLSSCSNNRKLRFEHCEDRRMLATITVNDPGDFIDANPNVTTLREGTDEANADPDHDTILFDLDPTEDTITLTEDELLITEAVTIDASMLSQGLTIDANAASRVFAIDVSTSSPDEADVRLEGLAITGGNESNGGAIRFQGGGSGTVTLWIEESTIFGNTAASGAGGLYATSGHVQIVGSTFTDNIGHEGGAIGFIQGDSLNIVGSHFVGNEATRWGGAINLNAQFGAVVEITDSSFVMNEAAGALGGGAIYSSVSAGAKFTVDGALFDQNRATATLDNGDGSREFDINVREPAVSALAA